MISSNFNTDKYLSNIRYALYDEFAFINAVLRLSYLDLKEKEYKKRSPAHAEAYEKAKIQLDSFYPDKPNKKLEIEYKQPSLNLNTKDISDVFLAKKIQEDYMRLMKEREDFFAEKKLEIANKKILFDIFKENLQKFGASIILDKFK